MGGTAGRVNMPYKKDPQKRPPKGWRVENTLFQSVLARAMRTNYQPLIERVKQMRYADRHDLVKIHDIISDAAKGEIAPESIDIDKLLEVPF